MGVKWVGGVCLAYMALAYIRDALPKETLHQAGAAGHGLRRRRAWSVLAAASCWGASTSRPSAASRPSRACRSRMKLASIVPAIAGLFMVLSWHQVSTASAPASALRWETSEQTAIKRANEEHKPILIDFGATWCGACKELEEKTFPDPKVQSRGGAVRRPSRRCFR